jgi:DNA-binding NarL/FixJ family response regulator
MRLDEASLISGLDIWLSKNIIDRCGIPISVSGFANMASLRSDVPTHQGSSASSPTVAPSARSDEVTARRLSGREREVLAHFAQGRSTKSVARILGISPRTIETYSAVIVQKLRARNRIHAIAIALRTGILTQQD